jgi:hypothetical protein
MTHPETAIAALFDHEQELEPARGRRRPAPDWGGDDLFSSTPRRRRRSRDIGERHLYAVPSPEDVEWSHSGRFRRDDDVPAPPVDQPPAPIEDAAEVAAVTPEDVEFTEIAAPDGRRTVTITGHPEPRVIRPRRPTPTVDQRIGHRPDRIAGWAFALGMLLILIAALTANI